MERSGYLSGYATWFYKDFAAYTAARLQEVGLNFGFLYQILYVGKHPECSQGEMKEALKLDWGYCQRSVERLVKDGFLKKEKSEGDRSWHLRLSERGEEAFRISHNTFQEWDREKLAGLTQEEKESLFIILKKIGAGRK